MFSQDVLARDETGQKGDPEKLRGAGRPPDESLYEIEQELLGGSGDAMEADPLLKHIRTRVTDEGLIIEVFDIEGSPLFDGADRRAEPDLRATSSQMIGRVLSRTANPVAVTGHLATGDVGRGGPDPWRLSADRAQLARELLEAAGVADARVARVTGKADRSPVDDGPAQFAQPAGRDHPAPPLRAVESRRASARVSGILSPGRQGSPPGSRPPTDPSRTKD